MWPTIALIVLWGIAALLVIAAVYHHSMLRIERHRITPLGTPVEVDGCRMNVYIEGEGSDAAIVLLSGSGVASPVYAYKILYSQLTDEYRVAVIEKFGYGFSDVSGLPRDTATMVREDREALSKAGIAPPYVLMPHSMSALEALYWARAYPGEVAKIIGLDMAVPDWYRKSNMPGITAKKILVFFGLHRIPSFCRVRRGGLAGGEYVQHRMLVYKNSLNPDVYEECRMAVRNAETVGKGGAPDVPILMFTTNLSRTPGYERWVRAQGDFAERAKHCVRIELDCGHDLQYEQSDYVAMEIKKFMKQ